MDNEWEQPPVRFSGAQPQNAQSRPQSAATDDKKSLLLGIRALNLLAGLGGAAAIAYSVQYPKQYQGAQLAFILAALVILMLDLVVKLFVIRRVPLQLLRWFNVGAIGGALIIWPLVITPKCGWLNDQCKPVHHAR